MGFTHWFFNEIKNCKIQQPPNLKMVVTKKAKPKSNSENVTVDPSPYDRKKTT